MSVILNIDFWEYNNNGIFQRFHRGDVLEDVIQDDLNRLLNCGAAIDTDQVEEPDPQKVEEPKEQNIVEQSQPTFELPKRAASKDTWIEAAKKLGLPYSGKNKNEIAAMCIAFVESKNN